MAYFGVACFDSLQTRKCGLFFPQAKEGTAWMCLPQRRLDIKGRGLGSVLKSQWLLISVKCGHECPQFCPIWEEVVSVMRRGLFSLGATTTPGPVPRGRPLRKTHAATLPAGPQAASSKVFSPECRPGFPVRRGSPGGYMAFLLPSNSV